MGIRTQRLDDLHTVTQKLSEKTRGLILTYQAQELQKLLLEADNERNANLEGGKTNLEPKGGVLRSPIHTDTPLVLPLRGARTENKRGQEAPLTEPQTLQTASNSPLRGDRERLRPIWSAPLSHTASETTAQQLP